MAGTALRRRAVALLVLLAACGDPAPDPPSDPGADGSSATTGSPSARFYERNFVFSRTTADSMFIVPWLMEATELSDTLIREARGWLGRNGTWEPFYAERWASGPSRTPSRIVPYGSLSLIAREGNVVDGIIFEEGPRRLELALGQVRATWVGPRGEAFELLDGAAFLSDQRVEGVVLRMARASTGSAPSGGDWALLTSGDSLQLVLAADSEHGGEAEPIYRAWARSPEDDLQWPEVRVDWAEAQGFPPARRDVPVAWRIWSSDGLIEGDLVASSAELQAGEGVGPLLPVLALFEVTGRIATTEGTFPVHGLLVHERR